VSDGGNFQVRKIDTTGWVSLFAGSVYGYVDAQGTAAQFNGLTAIACDKISGVVYVMGS
jgi:hypothetical protein